MSHSLCDCGLKDLEPEGIENLNTVRQEHRYPLVVPSKWFSIVTSLL